MKTCSVASMIKAEQIAEKKYGITPLLLMENAGRSLSDIVISEMFANKRSKVIVLCGKGNNGGDGFVCARHLFNKGIRVEVFVSSSAISMSALARLNYRIVKKMKIPVYNGIRLLSNKLKNKNTLLVDALLGTGFKGSPKGSIKSLIDCVASSSRPLVVSADVPSGINAETGDSGDCFVKAAATVSFACVKRGALRASTRRYWGKHFIVDIGLPKELARGLVNGR